MHSPRGTPRSLGPRKNILRCQSKGSALCESMSVSRSWYYEHACTEEKARKNLVLRDAIERIVLEFPGYRRVTVALRREEWSA
jgi:hypothetical protein